jgi:2'-5' RNA ligase/predicted N-acetyltransferase YhbS
MVEDRRVPRVRLAVALLVPARAAAEIDVLRRALGADTVRVAPHLTLVPPVNVAEGRLEEAEDLVRVAAAASRPIATVLGPPTTFLPMNPVVYLAVGPPAAVSAVEDLRARIFTGPLVRPLTWPFVPHVTVVDGGGEDRIVAAATALADHVVPVTFDAVALLREHRDDDGVRIWRPLLEARFGGPSVVGRGGLELELDVGSRLAHDAERWAAATEEDHRRARVGGGSAPDEPVTVTARRDGAVVGVAAGTCRDGDADLERLLVDPAVRREGIGSHLLAAYGAEAAERGAVRILTRAPAGDGSERFFVDRGFEAVATVPGPPDGDGDVVVLARRLV